jgi:hypothetical protein
LDLDLGDKKSDDNRENIQVDEQRFYLSGEHFFRQFKNMPVKLLMKQFPVLISWRQIANLSSIVFRLGRVRKFTLSDTKTP